MIGLCTTFYLGSSISLALSLNAGLSSSLCGLVPLGVALALLGLYTWSTTPLATITSGLLVTLFDLAWHGDEKNTTNFKSSLRCFTVSIPPIRSSTMSECCWDAGISRASWFLVLDYGEGYITDIVLPSRGPSAIKKSSPFMTAIVKLKPPVPSSWLTVNWPFVTCLVLDLLWYSWTGPRHLWISRHNLSQLSLSPVS